MTLRIKIVILIIGLLFTLFWLYLMIVSKEKYEEQIADIDSDEYFLPGLFQIGFCAIEKFNLDLHNSYFQKKLKNLIEIKGQEDAEYFLYVNVAGQISYVLTIIPIGMMFALIVDSIEIVVLSFVCGLILVYYIDYTVLQAVNNRHENLLKDLPTVLSKMALLINTGLILKEAWAKIAFNSNHELYLEMQKAEDEMNNGFSTHEALMNFSKQCNVKEIKKFISVIEQNLEKGSGELAKSLRELSEESWNEKKQRTIQKGAAADSKLLIPTGIIFMGILIVIIVPLFTNMF